MRRSSNTVGYHQFHLKLARRRPKSCFERINVDQKTDKSPSDKIQDEQKVVRRCRSQQKSITQSELLQNDHSLCTCNSSSHECVFIKSSETISGKVSQQILVSSALRRPHASYYSQLDSQILPEQARIARRPYRTKSASTVFSYAKRPVSASETSNHLGRQTKASLLRSKSAVEIHPPSPNYEKRPDESVRKKKPCVVQQEYMLHKNLLTPKEVCDYMKSVHAYLTGARYNRSRILDSKTLSKLGIYIPKDNLNAYIMKETKVKKLNSDDEEFSKATLDVIASKTCQADLVAVATNTESHYLSLDKWHSAEWTNEQARKQMKPSKRDCRRPVSPNKIKPIKTQYINYNNMVRAR